MANKKGSHQLTRTDRIKLEALIKAGLSKSKIAAQLGVHRSTIYNELEGSICTVTAITQRNCDTARI